MTSSLRARLAVSIGWLDRADLSEYGPDLQGGIYLSLGMTTRRIKVKTSPLLPCEFLGGLLGGVSAYQISLESRCQSQRYSNSQCFNLHPQGYNLQWDLWQNLMRDLPHVYQAVRNIESGFLFCVQGGGVPSPVLDDMWVRINPSAVRHTRPHHLFVSLWSLQVSLTVSMGTPLTVVIRILRSLNHSRTRVWFLMVGWHHQMSWINIQGWSDT